MLKFILKRLGSSLLVLFGASILLFFLVAHSGDPLQDLRESQNPNRETLIAARTEFMGLDQPWYARYWDWLQASAAASPVSATSASAGTVSPSPTC